MAAAMPAGSLPWLVLVYSLLFLVGFFDSIGFRGVLFISTTRLSGGAGSLLNLERWLAAIGALVMGWLLNTRKARWCFIVAFFCSVACDLVLLLTLNATTRCLARGISLLTHTVLVAQVVAVQESAASSRAYVLAHTALSSRLGSLLAEVANSLLWRGYNGHSLRVSCTCAVFGHLLALSLALFITREEGEQEGKGTLSALRDAVTVSSPSKWSTPSLSLPSPVSSSGDLDKDVLRPTTCLKQVLSQPVLLQLALVQLLAHIALNIKRRTMLPNLLNEFVDMSPWMGFIGRANKVGDVLGLALLIGTGISRFTPQAFICLCFAWEAAMSFLVSLDFATWNPHRRVVSIPVWISFVLADNVWDKARDTVITWLLVSAVPREQRSFMMGICLFMELVPSTPFSAILVMGVHPRGGAVGIFFASAVVNLVLLIVTRKLVLPRYRSKDE